MLILTESDNIILKQSQSSKKKKIWIAACSAVVVLAVLIIWLAYAIIPQTIFSGLTNYYMPNYAKDVARPIETALIKSGANKVCENATDGRTASSAEPIYNAYYQFSMPDKEVTQILQRIAKDNGHKLQSVPSDDKSVQNFEDRTSKNSTYTDLNPGKVEIVATLYSDTSDKHLAYCGGKGLVGDATHTILSLSVGLPSFK